MISVQAVTWKLVFTFWFIPIRQFSWKKKFCNRVVHPLKYSCLCTILWLYTQLGFFFCKMHGSELSFYDLGVAHAACLALLFTVYRSAVWKITSLPTKRFIVIVLVRTTLNTSQMLVLFMKLYKDWSVWDDVPLCYKTFFFNIYLHVFKDFQILNHSSEPLKFRNVTEVFLFFRKACSSR